MIIANIELSLNEDYSPFNCKKYGGGSIFCKYALKLLNNKKDIFFAYGQSENFENITVEEGKNYCVELPKEKIELLKSGFSVKELIPELVNCDILIHNQESFAFNITGLKCKQICWLAFVNQTVLPYNHACFVYSEYQNPILNPNYTRLLKIKIGNYVSPNFQEYKKDDYLFQITRMDSVMNPIKTVKLCNKFGIKGYFAGPILNNYPLMEHIDNKNTFYLGVLNELDKIRMLKGARLFGGIQDWDTIWNLSVHQALSYNTPVICYNRGFFTEIIQDKVDGFYYDDNEESFLKIWEESKNINQENCYNKALQYSEKEMVDSFYRNFEWILNNK